MLSVENVCKNDDFFKIIIEVLVYATPTSCKPRVQLLTSYKDNLKGKMT